MGIKHHGKHRHRLKDNPEEKLLAKAWQEANDKGDLLEYLMSPDNRRRGVTDEQVETVATVVQWLGSPVGRAFLRDAGYTLRENQPKKRRRLWGLLRGE